MGNNRGPGPSESPLSEKSLKEYSTPPQARGLHPPGALARTRWQVKKSPRQFYSNRPGARGLLSGTNIRIPEEEELMTVNIDSFARSRARLHRLPGHSSVQQDHGPRLKLTPEGWLCLA